jgi:isochorismate hydrolase
VAKSVEVPDYEVYGEIRVDPARAALIVVDMQNDFVQEGGSLLVPSAEATIPKIK